MRRLLALVLAAACGWLPPARAQEPDVHVFPAPAQEQERLRIHAAADLAAIAPLIRGFQATSPSTAVEYAEYVTNELYAEAAAACRGNRLLGDVLMSSAVDQLVRLANDGCAQAVDTGMIDGLPRWANWRDEVFGFSFEPVVVVYNRDKVPVEDVPTTHLELADLLRVKEAAYRGRVGTYDIRASGVGYLFAFNDSLQTTSTYGRLLESLGRAEAVVRCCSGQILDEVAAGRLLIGYNMLASYAYARLREGAPLGIVLPTDYTLVLSRGAMLSAQARDAPLGRRFIEYLLSPRGQAVARDEAFFFDFSGVAPPGVEGAVSVVQSGAARPIAIGPSLLAAQDAARRQRFIADWSRTLIDMGNQGP